MHSVFLLFLLVSLSLAEPSCKIALKVKSATKTPFRIQVYIPSLHQKTERVEFDGPGEKKVNIEGKDCMGKLWIFKTWKNGPDGEWIPVSETSAKLGGIGHFRIVVEDNLIPYGSDRMGVACSEANGSICG